MHTPKSNHSQITFTQLEARDEGLDMFSTVRSYQTWKKIWCFPDPGSDEFEHVWAPNSTEVHHSRLLAYLKLSGARPHHKCPGQANAENQVELVPTG